MSRTRQNGPIDAAHLLDLHSNLDDFQLVETGDLFGPVALLPFAQGDLVGQADKFTMRLPIRPAAATQAKKRVGGAADVGVGDESERGLVAQLRAYVGPLLEGRDHGDERDDRRDHRRSQPLIGKKSRNERRCDGNDRGDDVDDELPQLVCHMQRGEGDAVAGDGPGGEAFGDDAALVLAPSHQHSRRCSAAACAEKHPINRLALFAGQTDVQRGDRQHDSDSRGMRGREKPQKQAAYDPGQHRRRRREPEFRIERLEKTDHGKNGQKGEEEQDGVDGIGHVRSRLQSR